MTLQILGINHQTAPVEIRERVAFAPENMPAALDHVKHQLGAEEVVILSTCNRTEIYIAGETSSDALLQWLAEYHGVEPALLQQCYYIHCELDAVRHMIKVACGLDSMVLGEPQILGQVKSAYAVAQEADSLNALLNQAFQHAFAVAKRVRTETAIGRNPVSVAYAAVSLSQQIFDDLTQAHALLVGAGETIELVARHLCEKGVSGITLANRTLSRARELAEQFGAKAILLADIHDHLHQADIVITSTASQLPVLGKGAVESALKQRRRKPMFMVDIAVPRDIEPEVAQLDDVYLYTVDDLQEVIGENLRSRENAVSLAEDIIEEGVQIWDKQQRAMGAVNTIRAFRQSLEDIRDQELQRAQRALQSGQSPEDVLRTLAHGLTNKLLHRPTTRLKQAGEEGRVDHLELTHELFDLPVKPQHGRGKTPKNGDT